MFLRRQKDEPVHVPRVVMRAGTRTKGRTQGMQVVRSCYCLLLTLIDRRFCVLYGATLCCIPSVASFQWCFQWCSLLQVRALMRLYMDIS